MSIPEVLSALDRIHGTVSVIGSMNADYTVTAQRLPGPGETITGGPLQLLPGGKSGNQAAAAAKIGAAVRMFGRKTSSINGGTTVTVNFISGTEIRRNSAKEG